VKTFTEEKTSKYVSTKTESYKDLTSNNQIEITEVKNTEGGQTTRTVVTTTPN
jgi:hypothetical protein